MTAIQSKPALAARELIRHIMAEADAYAGEAPQHDDMTLVIVRFT
jgi:serine phosphatase RsbU (regulator of sigma subunit)